ncbi:transcriptional regulator FeaR [Oceanobacter mangrovi]|uniref:transcriptional regulator FeaR n=1 Tax=Oceanobacter mangrovi TaxID=2862510 RepID=UPI001C8E6E64|nr:transcriptional regulator FeaR [Oceanobacter mangrovi]
MINRDAEFHALDQWQTQMRAVCGNFVTQLPDRGNSFVGDFIPHQHKEIDSATIRTNAGRIFRSGTNADQEDIDHCFLVMHNSGFARFADQQNSLQLSPGDIFLMSGIKPCELTPAGLIEHVSFPLERQRVEHSLGGASPVFGKVNQRSTAGLMIRTMLDKLTTVSGNSSQQSLEKDAIEDAILTLLKPSLQYSDFSAEALGHMSRDIWQAAQLLINRNLQQGDLAPAMLAQQLNISVRQLHRIFEDHNDSVCRFILRSRLQQCASDLKSARMQKTSITSIAYNWGFADSAHFSRSFKKQYGVSPKEFRAGYLAN